MFDYRAKANCEFPCSDSTWMWRGSEYLFWKNHCARCKQKYHTGNGRWMYYHIEKKKTEACGIMCLLGRSGQLTLHERGFKRAGVYERKGTGGGGGRSLWWLKGGWNGSKSWDEPRTRSTRHLIQRLCKKNTTENTGKMALRMEAFSSFRCYNWPRDNWNWALPGRFWIHSHWWNHCHPNTLHAYKKKRCTRIIEKHRQSLCLQGLCFPTSDSHTPSLYIIVWLRANIICVLFISA